MPLQALDDNSLMEILSHLPLICLARLACVCKSWRNLISSPLFHNKLGRSITTHGFIIRSPSSITYAPLPSPEHKHSDAILDSSLALIPHFPNINIVDTCNGLLFYTTPYYPELYNVYNFARREHGVILCTSVVGPSEAIGIAFDPSVSRHFKLVFIACRGPRRPDRGVEVYSSEKGRTYSLDLHKRVVNALNLLAFRPKKPVFAGGALYFEAYLRNTHILRFDCDKETFGLVALDSKMTGESHKLRMGECKGNLHYAEFDSSASKVTVWSLDPKKGVWVWILEGSIPTRFTNELVKIEALHPDDEEIIFLRVLERILMYNLRDMMWKPILENAHGNAFQKEGEVFPIKPCFLQSIPRPPRW